MIVLLKKRKLQRAGWIIVAAILLVTAGFFLTDRNSYYLETIAAPESSKGTIVVDAGHGGMDGGAVSPGGAEEKNINLEIAKRLEYYLTQGGYTTVMTRVSDVSLHNNDNASIRNKKRSDLNNRKELIENAGALAYVSIHLNKFEQESVHGAQVFYGQKNEKSEALAESIRVSIVETAEPDNTRIIKEGDDSIFLLKNVTIPAVIVECGFLSNPEDEAKLQTAEYQDTIAKAIYQGIDRFVNGGGESDAAENADE